MAGLGKRRGERFARRRAVEQVQIDALERLRPAVVGTARGSGYRGSNAECRAQRLNGGTRGKAEPENENSHGIPSENPGVRSPSHSAANVPIVFAGQVNTAHRHDPIRGRQPAEGPYGGATHQRVGIVEPRRRERDQTLRAAIADGDHDIAQETRISEPLDRRTSEELAECRIVELRQFGEVRRVEIGASLQFGLPRLRGELVPRANGQTIVAAEDAIAHGGAIGARYLGFELYVQIGKALAGIEPERSRKGIGGTDIEATGARAAAFGMWFVGRQVRIGQNGAEKQPGAEAARDKDGMLALPADAGGLSEGLFHQRRGIDEDLDLGAGASGQKPRQVLELALDDVVIVAVAGIDRDIAGFARLEPRHRILVRPVIHPDHDKALRLRPKTLGCLAAIPRRFHPVHIAVPAFGQRGAELVRKIGSGRGGGDAEGVEAERFRPRLQFSNQTRRDRCQKSRSA